MLIKVEQQTQTNSFRYSLTGTKLSVCVKTFKFSKVILDHISIDILAEMHMEKCIFLFSKKKNKNEAI